MKALKLSIRVHRFLMVKYPSYKAVERSFANPKLSRVYNGIRIVSSREIYEANK